MNDVWQNLIGNLAVVAAVVMIWVNIRDVFARREGPVDTLVFGLVMGGGAFLAMTLGFEHGAGLRTDLRVAPIAVAGLFGGPLAAAVAAAPVLLYRFWLGGPATLPGATNILLVAGLAALQHQRLGQRLAGTRDILVLAGMTAAVGLVTVFLLPPPTIMPILVEAGLPAALLKMVGVLVVGFSVLGDERRRELVKANALYRAVIDALPDSLCVKDRLGRFITANPATARLMRSPSPGDLIGKTDFDFYPEATARRFREDELTVQNSRHGTTLDQLATLPDGDKVWLSTLKVPFRDEGGTVIGLITHNRDITDTKLLQMDLQRTRQHLADALANMADGLVLYDAEARIVMCNEQYRTLFPKTADLRVTGASLPDILRQAAVRGDEKVTAGVGVETWIETILVNLRRGGDGLIEMEDGRWIETRTRAVADGGFLTMFSDVTGRLTRERDLQRRAEHDPLTGLANRAAFQARLEDAERTATAQGTEFAVLMIDLDSFKQVNDRFGHGVGDRLLVEVARRLEAVCRQGDLVARLGGDEFAILTEGVGLEVGAARHAQRLLDGLLKPFNSDGISLLPGGSVGIATFPADADDADSLVKRADEALYAAKASGRRRWVAYGNLPSTSSALTA